MQGIELTAKASKGENDASVLHFKVENKGSRVVGLFVGFPFKDRPQAYLDVDGSILHVRKVYLDKPKNYNPDEWLKPSQVLLKPGESYEEDIVLPSRAKAYNPLEAVQGYAPLIRTRKATRETSVSRAVLHVGVFETDPSMQVRPDPLNPRWVEIWKATQDVQVQIETTVELPQALTVLDYD